MISSCKKWKIINECPLLRRVFISSFSLVEILRPKIESPPKLIEKDQLERENLSSVSTATVSLNSSKRNSVSQPIPEKEIPSVAPEILSTPEDVRTKEGESVRFHLRIFGEPEPKVEWYLNGQQLRKSKRFSLWFDGLYHLEINPVTVRTVS